MRVKEESTLKELYDKITVATIKTEILALPIEAFPESYLKIEAVNPKADLGIIFEEGDGLFSWNKSGVGTIILSKDEVLYFIKTLNESSLFSEIISNDIEIGITSYKPIELFEELIKHGIMRKWLNLPNKIGYELNTQTIE